MDQKKRPQSFGRNSRPSIPKHRLVIGRKPVIEALESGTTIEKIFVLKTMGKDDHTLIKKTAERHGVPTSLVPVEKLNRLTRSNHQGVVAIAGLVDYQPLQEVISQTVDSGKTPLIVMVDGVTDTRNLGAIARSAFCYGAHALVIPATKNAAITEDAVKTSAGALEHLAICKTSSIQEAVKIAKLNGLQVAASALDAPRNLNTVDFTIPTALVMGAEDTGVSGFVIKNADAIFRIPMPSDFESLNVAVATGIALYEHYRQNNA